MLHVSYNNRHMKSSTNHIHQERLWAHHVWMNRYGVVIHPSAYPETQMGRSDHSDDKLT